MAGDAAENAVAAVLLTSDRFEQRFGPRFRGRANLRPRLELHVKLHRLVQRGLCERVFDAQIRSAVLDHHRRAGKIEAQAAAVEAQRQWPERQAMRRACDPPLGVKARFARGRDRHHARARRARAESKLAIAPICVDGS